MPAAVETPPAEPEVPKPQPPTDEADDVYALAPLAAEAPTVPLRPAITADAGGALRIDFIPRELPSQPAGRAKSPLRVADLDAAFQGYVGRLRPGLTYQLGLFLAALVMLAIPIVYAALIVGAGYGVYLWATEMVWLLRFGRFVAVAYLMGLVGLSISTLFLLKPFVRWERRGAAPLAVHRAEEPLLFEFVDRVCDAVDARQPRRIELICEPTAFVRFRHPLWSMVSGETVLGIGLPLVGGLRIDQLGGVLAHELGHANQFVGMRLHGLVMHVYLWIARQVYEEDGFDAAIEEWTSSDGWFFPALGLAAALGVAISRGVLWLMAPPALAVARYLSRRQEFDADRYTTRLIGSQAYCTMHRSIIQLNVGYQAALEAYGASLARGEDHGHLPGMTVDMSRQLLAHGVVPPQPEDMPVERTALFDTHPANADRMLRALEEEAEPLLVLPRSSRDLFSDYDTLSEAATRRLLRDLRSGGDD